MLNDKQSLVLTGFMVVCIFVFGLLEVLNNFIVLTVLTIVFFIIIINLCYTKFKSEDSTQNKNNTN